MKRVVRIRPDLMYQNSQWTPNPRRRGLPYTKDGDVFLLVSCFVFFFFFNSFYIGAQPRLHKLKLNLPSLYKIKRLKAWYGYIGYSLAHN